MSFNGLAWLIWLPLAATPFVYLMGRLRQGQWLWSSRWLALLTLLATWLPFVFAVQEYRAEGTLTLTVGTIMLRLDGLSLLLTAVVLTLATLIALYSAPYMAGQAGEEKYYAMLLALTGVIIGLSCAADLFNLWLWFEATAVTSYLLVAFYREQPTSLEAGVKYLVQSTTGSVLVLFGVAIVFAQTGTLDLAGIRAAVQDGLPTGLPLLAAAALFVAGFGVKMAVVPMHTWLADAHAQAPSGISAMLSGVVIEAGLVALLRASTAVITSNNTWGILLLALGSVNMLAGNLLALRQKRVKRLLAFSSLAHMGYMLLGLGIAVYAGETAGAQGSFFHLINHGLMKGLAFLAAGALLYALHSTLGDRPLMVDDLAGAARRYPLAALALSLALLGLAGLPPLAGFASKWQILAAGMTAHTLLLTAMVGFAALNSVLSLAYYLPVVNVLYRRQQSPAMVMGQPLPAAIILPLIVLAAAIIVIGLWPGLLNWLTEAAEIAVFGIG
ncbi:MAG: proton-conducting transporter membrane subunit [Candidatus Promineifilaceae bacterium]